MHRSRSAAAFFVPFILLGLFSIPLFVSAQEPNFDEADDMCPKVTETNVYRSDKDGLKEFEENGRKYFNVYGTFCKDIEGKQVAANGICVAANTCRADPTTGCGGGPCKLPDVKVKIDETKNPFHDTSQLTPPADSGVPKAPLDRSSTMDGFFDPAVAQQPSTISPSAESVQDQIKKAAESPGIFSSVKDKWNSYFSSGPDKDSGAQLSDTGTVETPVAKTEPNPAAPIAESTFTGTENANVSKPEDCNWWCSTKQTFSSGLEKSKEIALSAWDTVTPGSANAGPSNDVVRKITQGETITGEASIYDPSKPGGYKSGGMGLATGGTYNPKAYEAALQLNLAMATECGYGAGKTCFAQVDYGGKSLIVTINDNGPLMEGRIIDLNRASMDYFNGGGNSVLEDVKVTLLEGGNHTPGPISPTPDIPLPLPRPDSAPQSDFISSAFAATPIPVNSDPLSVITPDYAAMVPSDIFNNSNSEFFAAGRDMLDSRNIPDEVITSQLPPLDPIDDEAGERITARINQDFQRQDRFAQADLDAKKQESIAAQVATNEQNQAVPEAKQPNSETAELPVPRGAVNLPTFSQEAVELQEKTILKSLEDQGRSLQEMSETLSDDAVARGMAACESAPAGRLCRSYQTYSVAVQTEQAKYDLIVKNYDSLLEYKKGGQLNADLTRSLAEIEKGQGGASAAIDAYAKPYQQAAKEWFGPVAKSYTEEDWVTFAKESWKSVPALGNMVWGGLATDVKIMGERLPLDALGFTPAPEEAARCGAVSQGLCDAEGAVSAGNVVGAVWGTGALLKGGASLGMGFVRQVEKTFDDAAGAAVQQVDNITVPSPIEPVAPRVLTNDFASAIPDTPRIPDVPLDTTGLPMQRVADNINDLNLPIERTVRQQVDDDIAFISRGSDSPQLPRVENGPLSSPSTVVQESPRLPRVEDGPLPPRTPDVATEPVAPPAPRESLVATIREMDAAQRKLDGAVQELRLSRSTANDTGAAAANTEAVLNKVEAAIADVRKFDTPETNLGTSALLNKIDDVRAGVPEAHRTFEDSLRRMQDEIRSTITDKRADATITDRIQLVFLDSKDFVSDAVSPVFGRRTAEPPAGANENLVPTQAQAVGESPVRVGASQTDEGVQRVARVPDESPVSRPVQRDVSEPPAPVRPEAPRVVADEPRVEVELPPQPTREQIMADFRAAQADEVARAAAQNASKVDGPRLPNSEWPLDEYYAARSSEDALKARIVAESPTPPEPVPGSISQSMKELDEAAAKIKEMQASSKPDASSPAAMEPQPFPSEPMIGRAADAKTPGDMIVDRSNAIWNPIKNSLENTRDRVRDFFTRAEEPIIENPVADAAANARATTVQQVEDIGRATAPDILPMPEPVIQKPVLPNSVEGSITGTLDQRPPITATVRPIEPTVTLRTEPAAAVPEYSKIPPVVRNWPEDITVSSRGTVAEQIPQATAIDANAIPEGRFSYGRSDNPFELPDSTWRPEPKITPRVELVPEPLPESGASARATLEQQLSIREQNLLAYQQETAERWARAETAIAERRAAELAPEPLPPRPIDEPLGAGAPPIVRNVDIPPATAPQAVDSAAGSSRVPNVGNVLRDTEPPLPQPWAPTNAAGTGGTTPSAAGKSFLSNPVGWMWENKWKTAIIGATGYGIYNSDLIPRSIEGTWAGIKERVTGTTAPSTPSPTVPATPPADEAKTPPAAPAKAAAVQAPVARPCGPNETFASSGCTPPYNPYTPPYSPVFAPAIPNTNGQILSQDYYCITSITPVVVVPLSAGTRFPSNCYNSPSGGSSTNGILAALMQRAFAPQPPQAPLSQTPPPGFPQTPPFVPPTQPPVPPTPVPAAVALIANPSVVEVDGTSLLSWASIGTKTCEVGSPANGETLVKEGKPDGSVRTPELAITTVFRIKCTTAEKDIFATTTVRVK